MTATLNTCSYEGCNNPIYSPHDENLCLFHTSADNKHISGDQYDQFLRDKIRRNELNFDGYIFVTTEFLYSTHIRSVAEEIKLTNCKFSGEKQIGDKKFCLNIEGVAFNKGIDFTGSKFSNSIQISNATIRESIVFDNCTIEGDLILRGGSSMRLFIGNSKISNDITLHKHPISREFEIHNSIIGGLSFLKATNFTASFHSVESDYRNFVSFPQCTFNKTVSFYNCNFYGQIEFAESIFKEECLFNGSVFDDITDFEKIKFHKEVQFGDVQFNKNVTFNDSEFFEKSLWINAKLDTAFFNNTTFNGEADFSKCSFDGNTQWVRTKFLNRAIFNEASFLVNKHIHKNISPIIYFQNTEFNYVVEFKKLKAAGHIIFDNLYLIEKSIFYFQEVEFVNTGRVIFKNTSFPSFTAFFESIKNHNSRRALPSVIALRSCNLKDIYFTNNDMSLFSFYKSAYDNAIFTSNSWDDKKEKLTVLNYTRKNLIFEDQLLNRISRFKISRQKKILEQYLLNDLLGFEEIATLYRRFKVALDSTKDYEQAGWFYFNEYEMKRIAAKAKSKSKYFVYSIYKLFAGYGEKPLWSLTWLGIWFFLFSFLNLFSGIIVNGGQSINYELSWSMNIPANIFSDYGKSFLFTLYRILPVGYLPFPKDQFIPIGYDGYLLSFLNTIILILFITFFGVGLKRIFRRF